VTVNKTVSYSRILHSPTALALLALSPIGAAGAASLLMLVGGRGLVALVLAAGTLLALLVLIPRVSFFIFLASLSFWIPQRLTATFAIHPFDVLLAVVFAGVALEFLLKSHGEIRSAHFDLLFLLLIAATLISAILAYRPAYSVVPLMRVVVIYLAFRVSYKFAREFGVRRILLFYLAIVTLLSVYNFGTFLIHGGRMRVFGPAMLGYEPMSMTALPMALAFMLWSRRSGDRILYASVCVAIALGILATEARGPLLSVLISVPALLWFARRKARREADARTAKSVSLIGAGLAALLFVAAIANIDLLAGAYGRYQEFVASLRDPQGTVALRLILWKTALRTFLDHPIAGIGVGNFRIVHDIYPDVRLIPQYILVKGMSAHNVILHYLAETGLIGALSLLMLAISGLRTVYRTFRLNLRAVETQVSAALFIGLLVFVFSLFYMREWTWGQGSYVMALLFGLAAAWYQQTVERKGISHNIGQPS
jgi:O-antigen ligase